MRLKLIYPLALYTYKNDMKLSPTSVPMIAPIAPKYGIILNRPIENPNNDAYFMCNSIINAVLNQISKNQYLQAKKAS